MRYYTAEQVLAACPNGPATGARARALVDLCSGFCYYPHRITLRRAAGIWVLEFVYGRVPPEDAAGLVRQADAVLPYLEYTEDDRAVVTVTAGRYVGFTGVGPVYDAVDAGWVDVIPDDWFETRVFSVNAILKLCKSRLGEPAGTAYGE